MSEMKNGNGEEHPNAVSVFIGLGPAASTISDEALRQRLEEVVPVLGVRIRGRCAFADVPDLRAAERLVAELDSKFIGEARMTVQISRTKEKDRPSASASGGGGGRTSIFVGLGPAGGVISDKELRNKLEEVAPVVGFRRRGQCAFVDVAEVSHASRMIQELNNQYMGDCRLSVQYSRDNKQSRHGVRTEKRARSEGRRRHHHNRSRRSDSPDNRRRRRYRSRSYSSRSSSGYRSSVASEDSRDYRRRDRRRRDRSRSRSYSSRSRSSSHSYRRRRD